MGTYKHKRWDKTGTVVEQLPFRKYRIRLDGSGMAVTRNRRFLRQSFLSKPVSHPIISTLLHALPNTSAQDSSGVPTQSVNSPPISASTPFSTAATTSHNAQGASVNPEHSTTTAPVPLTHSPSPLHEPLSRVPRALSRLAGFNKPGLLEG